MSNITQVINVDKNLKTLKKGVHASDMDQLLSSSGPYTFLAPSDMAFEKLDKDFMEKLLEPQNRAKLADLLSNHLLKGKISFLDLKDGVELTTVNGKQLTVKNNNGTIHLGDIHVTAKDTKISNGVIHSVDAVIQ